jgi:ADP-dependent NAD(P)H-hydrate dehydratase / NAD(P)H-hydrate epimerase
MVASGDLPALDGAAMTVLPFGRPILTADAMRAAEQEAIDSGTTVEELMERAGAALAEALYRFAGPTPALFLCGPGNNGGDGYVAARHLAARGVPVRVAQMTEPKSDAAKWARAQWTGDVEALSISTAPAPLVIDCLFGTGLKCGLEDDVLEQLSRLCRQAVVRVACDLPSGVDSDSGAELSEVPAFDMTVTFGALKPAHLLYPAMHKCGRVVLGDIGIAADASWHEIGAPSLPPLDPGGHKYDRGLVHALAGKMPGAIALAAKASARAGAGYVRVSTSRFIEGLPAAVVQTDTAEVNDERIGCLLVGPGMGDIPQVLTLALTSKAPKVIDADAITQMGEPERLRGQDAILTPHEGEFRRLFGEIEGAKPERALESARRSGAVIVYKGPDTLVASPDGRIGFRPPAPAWLASAGTGDVLAGVIAAMRARGLPAFEAACAGVWLQREVAEIAGAQMIADDLAEAIPDAIALCTS